MTTDIVSKILCLPLLAYGKDKECLGVDSQPHGSPGMALGSPEVKPALVALPLPPDAPTIQEGTFVGEECLSLEHPRLPWETTFFGRWHPP